ncbi:MAG: hypothetical protein HY436_00070 [Candidatus Liptonbacteria bacterium]|nr:hypothetical protein [Candidatus Liptonbacteria bacterium]
MRQQTKRFVSLVMAIAFFAAALVLFSGPLQAEYRLSQELKAELLSQREFLAREKEAVAKVETLIAGMKSGDAAALQEAIARTLPFGEDVGGAVVELNGIARANGLSLSALSVSARPSLREPSPRGRGAPELLRPLGRLGFALEATGSYGNLKRFLRDVETNLRMFEVAELMIDPAGRADQDLYRFRLSIVAYYQTT